MTKIYPQLILFIIISCFLFPSCSQTSSKTSDSSLDYLLVDEKPDSIAPAGIEELRIESSGNFINGFIYTANGKELHPTLIFLHGLPGNERNLDIAQSLRRAGYNVLYFDYRGSWGSGGTFSFENSLKDISAVLDYISDPQNKERLRINSRQIALVGHSMGAGLALIEGINDPRIKAIAAISVFNPYTIFSGKEVRGNLLSLKEYISTLGVLNCDPDSFLKEILKNRESYNIAEMVKKSKKPILVIDEHKNNNYFADYSDKKTFTYKMWNTDHAFTNKRIALSKELNSWLHKNLPR